MTQSDAAGLKTVMEMLNKAMRTVIVKSEEEATVANEQAEKDGLQWAATSNTGLPEGYSRMTFLPKSAFKKEGQPCSCGDPACL